ncbi:evolutionarily conserved C-terminal region 7 [Striga asiatica]|uniref:Evolutionarily conserved C-terminal region 7 n=1 Tax=Striga asiatica TaxID=4170 RepID=A0A5A7RJU7_STRAF|nr:evolutionarily conserved C-terminal region 7 [Striga asiatica]
MKSVFLPPDDGDLPEERRPAEIDEMRENDVTMASRPAYTMLFTNSPFHGSFGLRLSFFPFINGCNKGTKLLFLLPEAYFLHPPHFLTQIFHLHCERMKFQSRAENSRLRADWWACYQATSSV